MPSKMIKNIEEIIADSEELKNMLLEMQKHKKEQIRRINVFTDDSLLVSYESLMELPKSQPIKIEDGVIVERSSSDYDNNLHIIASLTKGAIFKEHFHKHWEYKLITKGRLRDNKEHKILAAGKIYEFKPYQLHEIEALEDTVVRVIGSKSRIIPEQTDFKN